MIPALPGALKRKRVLLVDASSAQRDLRAEVMRKLGIDVDCAADIGEARSWWRADLYGLVLLHVENDFGHRDKFCEDVRNATPPQQLAFLVGKPDYLANSPTAVGSPLDMGTAAIVPVANPFPLNLSYSPPQRWGIMEASKRISAVRSAASARTKAMRDRPEPARDVEKRDVKRSAWSEVLPELQKEEMQ